MCNYSPLPCYFLVPRPHFSERPMRVASRGPSDLCFSRPYVSDTSPKSIDREGLERRRGGTWQTMIHLIYPPPPFPPAAPALSLVFLGTTVIPGRNWRQWLWKLLGGKQGYAYYGQCENGEFSPFNKTIWCLICFVVFQIYADTLWNRGNH